MSVASHGARVTCALLLAVTTAQAQSTQSAPSSTAALVPIGAPAGLAGLIRDGVKLKPPQKLDGAELSPLRRTSGPQLGDSMLCLKTMAEGRTAFIAVFFESGKVLSYRRAVVYDRCEQDVYALLAAAPRAKPAPVKPGRGKPAHAGAVAQPPSAAATAD